MIPDKIKIAGHVVEILHDYVFQDRNDIMGQAMADGCVIKLSSCKEGVNRITETCNNVNFIHECLHIVSNKFALHLSEDQILILSEVLYQVLKDNNIDFRERKDIN